MSETTYTLHINGRDYETTEKKSLLRFLRDDLHFTSVKDGCSQGACGACTVIIDGETYKSCVPTTDRLVGKNIITVEGLTPEESKLYTFAYGEAGAVQCGFCIPGMVMCTKALLDKNPHPTEEEIRYALRNNYCRCTGYVKIIEAVKIAARLKAEGIVPEKGENWQVGQRVHRLDVPEKVQGWGKYPDDYYPENTTYGSALRAKYPRARVLSIDTTKAKALPGVVAVLTAEDIPGENKIGHLKHDQYTLIPVGGLTHYLGDAIALVVAEDRATLEKAKKLIQVEYEVLEPVHTIAQAKEGKNLVFDEETSNVQAYEHIHRGDAAAAIAKAPFVITHHFETPWTEHAFLEPEACTAFLDEDGDIFIYSTDQSAHQTLHECQLMLGTDKIKVQNALVGGGFGGKEDMTVQHLAALAVYHTHRPVKMNLTREESLLIHPKRHPFSMDFTMGCDENGKILGVKAVCETDTGAFASLGGPVLQRACTHAAGPYAYENFEIEGTAYYTNNPPSGAFRGFGVTQTCFATETLLNMMAEKIGISPWEIRYRNAIRPGGVLPNGQIVDDSTGLAETLEEIKPYYEAALAAGDPVGLACAMKNAGVGVGIPDYGRVKLIVEGDRKVHIYAGASCIGQGLGTVLVQNVVQYTGLPREDVVYERSNTWIGLDSGTTSGSRQTLVTGEACIRACRKLRQALDSGKTMGDLAGELFYGEYENDFFLTWEKTDDEIEAVFTVADALRYMRENNISTKIFESGLGISLFRDNSTRTRFSFASACNLLGLEVQDLDEGKSQIANGETVRETANMVSFMADVIGIRDDMYIGKGNKYMHEFMDAVTTGNKDGILEQKPTLVNLQCDIDHPTQAMADMLHIIHEFGGVENLKGKKIAMTWAYSPSYGKPLSVPQGIIGLMTRFGMDVVLAHPEGYEVMPEVEEVAKANAQKSGGTFTKTNSMAEAFKDADIVYPKSWAPFAAMEKRTELYGAGNMDGVKKLEKELLAQNAEHKDWCCTEELMATTHDGKALYMHCLPADINDVSCKDGEVAASVFDRYRDPLYKEASFKPYIIAAMIFLAKVKDPQATLKALEERGVARWFQK